MDADSPSVKSQRPRMRPLHAFRRSHTQHAHNSATPQSRWQRIVDGNTCRRGMHMCDSHGMQKFRGIFAPPVHICMFVACVSLQDISSHPVFVYMKGTPTAPQCGFSRQVVKILDHLGVEYGSRNVLEDSDIRDAIKKFSYVHAAG